MIKQLRQSNLVPSPINDNEIVRTGRNWRIVYDSMQASVRNRKGLSYLLPLLQNPGASLSVLQISHVCKLPGTFVPRVITTDEINDEPSNDHSPDSSSEKTLNCPELIGSVSDQLKLLWDHIELAQARGDKETWMALEDKQQEILASIARVQDSKGELFELNKRQHNTRSSICQQIRGFIKADLAPSLPKLAEHLSESLNYGLECCYSPNNNARWVIKKG